MEKIYRKDYTEREWFNLMKSQGENLPSEYCDIFERDGEIAEEYQDIMNSEFFIKIL